MDFAAAGLLEGLDGDEREARERLLEQLIADGVSLEELKAAVQEQRLALLPVDRVLGGRYTAREIEQRTGVAARFMIGYRRALGLPEPSLDDRVFGEDDIEAAKSNKMFLDAGFSEEGIVEITRVLGEGMARLAATITAAFVETFLRPGDTEQDVATRFANLSEQLTPAVKPILAAAFNQHLRDSVQRGAIGRAELESGQLPELDVTVCFADLVGFTRLARHVELQEVGSVAGGLAQLAADATTRPVRLIKTIGDAAMFVSPEPAPMVTVALSLIEAAQAADLPALRAGIASGPALLRAGDYFGHSVNLASRVTGVARPGSVLCTEEIRDAAPEKFDWSFAGRHKLKGVAEPLALYRARPLERAAADRDGAKRRRADRPRKRARR